MEKPRDINIKLYINFTRIIYRLSVSPSVSFYTHMHTSTYARIHIAIDKNGYEIFGNTQCRELRFHFGRNNDPVRI